MRLDAGDDLGNRRTARAKSVHNGLLEVEAIADYLFYCHSERGEGSSCRKSQIPHPPKQVRNNKFHMRLANKVALITGGTSGIGEATALLFAKEGAKVAVTGRNESRGRAMAAQLLERGSEAIFLRSDVRNAEECHRAVEVTVRSFGRLDILFNNAGVFYPDTTLECSEEKWDLQIDINLKGTFLMSKFALPSMIAQGSGVIINNSSGWGIVGGDKAVAYCASKGGVVLLTKAMAIDHGRQGIRVNCICPGDVDTPMLPQDARLRGLDWNAYIAGCANRPMGRIGTAEEIAKAVLFLASDDSSFMTGAALVVDGGGTAD
jgi:NAD(P)-dependent dehydrogenase (short-subunit alcohol dehydrogenase family)